jgi:glucosamine--fructose-6-phosphate aminotransferase (isomerizing)
MRHLPVALQAVLALEPQVIGWAEVFARKENALFLGRGLHYPIALEGALKLKEISYIHAEAYRRANSSTARWPGDQQHAGGDRGAQRRAAGKAQEQHAGSARARRRALRAGRRRHRIESSEGMHVIRMPEHYGASRPSCTWCRCNCWPTTRPARGTDVDKPRNLAKSVTVE